MPCFRNDGSNPLARQDPIGQNMLGTKSGEAQFTVIGVVRDARLLSLAKPDPMMVYMPYWYRANLIGGLVVRTQQEPTAMADAIRKTVWSVDPSMCRLCAPSAASSQTQ